MWIPLMDYAMKKGVSLSTLRRYIKANKIEYRVEKGRYLLADDLDIPRSPLSGGAIGFVKPAVPSAISPSPSSAGDSQLRKRVERLERELQESREEIAELKTLIALYEEKMA